MSLIDIYPTLIELCKLPNDELHRPSTKTAPTYDELPSPSPHIAVPRPGKSVIQKLDGVSLVPLIRNPNARWDRPAVIEYKRGNAAVRSNRYRYIRYHDGGEELYDHKTDPYEWNNLASNLDHANVREELAGWITNDWSESAPTKKAFRFEHTTFTWTNKKTGTITNGNAVSTSHAPD